MEKGGRDGLGTARSSYGVGKIEFRGEVGSGSEEGMFGIRGREVIRNGEAEGGSGEVGCDIWEGLRG